MREESGQVIVERCVALAERASRAGQSDRAAALLGIALELATPAEVPMVLLAWERHRGARRASTESRTTADRRGRRDPVPEGAIELARSAHPAVAPPARAPLPRARPKQPGAENPRSSKGQRSVSRGATVLRLGLVPATLGLLIAAGVASGRVTMDKWPGTAAEKANTGDAPVPAAVLLEHASKRISAGDTVGAVGLLLQAARADVAGDGTAWEAAERLSMLPVYDAEAAEAYLLAFGAGLPRWRWERVAQAQEDAGYAERATRIRLVMAREDGDFAPFSSTWSDTHEGSGPSIRLGRAVDRAELPGAGSK